MPFQKLRIRLSVLAILLPLCLAPHSIAQDLFDVPVPPERIADRESGSRVELLPAVAPAAAGELSESVASELKSLRKRIEDLEKGGASSSTKDSDPTKSKSNSNSNSDSAQKASDKKGDSEKKPDAEKKPDGDKKVSAEKKADAEKSNDIWQDMSSDKWTVKLGGHVQLDLINWAHAEPNVTGAQDYFEFRRLRLVAEGTGYGVYDFRLQMTLEPETVGDNPPGAVTSPDVKDAYFSLNEIPRVGRMRIGNFFVPFSLEQVTNDTNNIFMERSIPTQGVFSPDREVGIACYNCSLDQNRTWSYGVFLDSISESLKERIDDNQGYRLSGRWTWLPYYDEPSNGRYLLHTGVGLLHTNDQDNRVRFRARPQIHEGPRLIDSGILDADKYTVGNLEMASVFGPLTIQSEAFLSSIDMVAGNATTIYGAYVHSSFFLTGENRIFERFGQHGAQFGRNVPYSNFFMVPGGFGPGAWEAKARWSFLDLNHLDRGRYNDITTGFNWYWSDRTRVMFDWIHPFTTKQTVFGTGQADLLAMRFDFNW